jgi:hypothetical protein
MGLITLEKIQQTVKLKIKKKIHGYFTTKQFAHRQLTVHCIHIAENRQPSFTIASNVLML